MAGVAGLVSQEISLSDNTRVRAPTMTLTHHGGMDIEELDKSQLAVVPFNPLTRLKAFVVANALSELNAPKATVSPLVQHLPNLWDLFHDFGLTTLELNPIRLRADPRGRLTPVDGDIKCGFDLDDPRWQMKTVARICFKHWLKQSNALFIIGGKSNNTDIFETAASTPPSCWASAR